MWTNEFEEEETITTVIDEESHCEDVTLFIDDSGVYIRQWCENTQSYNLISMSHMMWYELQAAMDTSEGMYALEKEE